MSAAWVSCTARQVSSTSDEVMPWCTKRASGPTCSARLVRKAMTSCLVSRSIASMRAISNLPLARSALAADFGTVPCLAMASRAWASISNQMRNRFSGAQMALISFRLYRGIIGSRLSRHGIAQGRFRRNGCAVAPGRRRREGSGGGFARLPDDPLWRQADNDGGAGARGAADLKAAVMQQHKALGQRQSQASAGVLLADGIVDLA